MAGGVSAWSKRAPPYGDALFSRSFCPHLGKMWTKRGQDHFFDRIFTASALHPPTSKNPVTVGISGFYSFFHRNSDSHGSAHHGVVAHAQEAHHLHVRGDGAGAGELRVAVHTAHGVGHAVGGGAGSHVVRVQRAAGAAAGGHGEVLLALLDALLLIGTGHRVLEAGGVGGVAGDGHIHALVVHNGLIY